MTKHSIKRKVSRAGRGSGGKQSDRDKSAAIESIESLMQLHKLQGVLLAKLQDQIKKIKA
jgi:hypothetical protein